MTARAGEGRELVCGETEAVSLRSDTIFQGGGGGKKRKLQIDRRRRRRCKLRVEEKEHFEKFDTQVKAAEEKEGFFPSYKEN